MGITGADLGDMFSDALGDLSGENVDPIAGHHRLNRSGDVERLLLAVGGEEWISSRLAVVPSRLGPLTRITWAC